MMQISETAVKKWETKLNRDINWSTSFKKIQRIREIKVKWFQITLVHSISATNVVLMHMGVNNQFDCSFCIKSEIVLIINIFGRCNFVKPVWEQLQRAVSDTCINAISVTLMKASCFLGTTATLNQMTSLVWLLNLQNSLFTNAKSRKNIP